MLKQLVAALVIVASTLGVAHARSSEMFFPQRTAPVVTRGQAGKQALHDAIVAAAKARGWMIRSDTGSLLTLYYTRGKIEATITVAYDETSYQIGYVSSENLNYEVEDGKAMIHPRYNDWIKNLQVGISREY